MSHFRELSKPSATGPLALLALTNSELKVHGDKSNPLDLNYLHKQSRRVLVLFPSETSRTLTQAVKHEDPRPITLVVPDGNWRQATRICRRVPGLSQATRVTLPEGAKTEWGVRREPKAMGLATFEAISRALRILASPKVSDSLDSLFARFVSETLATRGNTHTNGTDIARSKNSAPLPPLQILYQDSALVAVNKPSGQLVHRGWAGDGPIVLQQLRDQIGRYVYPVHRLDRATSGVLLFALSSEVAADTQRLFQDGNIKKRYLALCRGCDSNLTYVDHPLAQKIGPEKKDAYTALQLLGSFQRYGLYAAYPKTGRTHQIRRHLKHASHPIIGDTRYGKGEHNRFFREHFGFCRLALHHQQMTFPHPRENKTIQIDADLPKDFQELLEKIGLTQVTAPDNYSE